MKTHNNADIQVDGTFLVGKITATRSQLEACFGAPIRYDEGGKVTTEWHVEFDDNTVATIYDWKRYDQGTPVMNEVYHWHIGGASRQSVLSVHAAFREKLGFTAAIAGAF